MIEFDLQGKEYIQLNDLLKITKLVGTGGEANIRITEGEVLVNGLVETRKRNKVRSGSVVLFDSHQILVK